MTDASPYLAFIGRILLSIIFIVSGLSKVFDPAGTLAQIGNAGLPAPYLAYIGAIAIELGGAIALIVGWRARWVGLALAAYCLITAAFFHRDFADPAQAMNFWKNVAMAGGFLYVAGFGAGVLAWDNRRRA